MRDPCSGRDEINFPMSYTFGPEFHLTATAVIGRTGMSTYDGASWIGAFYPAGLPHRQTDVAPRMVVVLHQIRLCASKPAEGASVKQET